MKLRAGYLKRLLAGATFGMYMANLLYLLNPQIELRPARFVLVTFVYATICALLVGTFLWIFRLLRVRVLGRPDGAYRPHGFGFVVASAYLSALVYWGQLALFRIYLPRGPVRLLSKSTTIIGVTATILFILWLIERNATPKLSRAILLTASLVIALSAGILYTRRDHHRPSSKARMVVDVGPLSGMNRVSVVAVRNVSYDWIVTMIGEGQLPFFQKAREHSFLTRLEPFPATSSKPLWTSLATGQLPHRHGVTGRFTYRTALNRNDDGFLLLPFGIGFRAWGLIPPVERISAPLPAGDSLPFWKMFERVGARTATINWPASPSRSQSLSMVVPDRFFKHGNRVEIWPPAERAAVGNARPDCRELERDMGGVLARLRSPLRESVSRSLCSDEYVQRVARGAIDRGDARLVAVTLNGLAEVAQTVGAESNELPPKTSVEGLLLRMTLERIDTFLGSIQTSHPDETLIVVSPSGPRPPGLPSSLMALAFARLLDQELGADDGFFLLAGPSSLARPNPASAEIVDAVPTLLFSAGLPVARDLDGRVFTESFSDDFLRAHSVSVIPTYEAEPLTIRATGP